MAEDQRRAGNALALGQQHVIGIQNFDHLTAGKAGNGGHGKHRQRNAGQNAGTKHILGREQHREPLQLEAEGVAQRQCEHIGRHRHTDDRDDGGQSVENGIPLESGNDAQDQTHDGTQRDSHAAHADGDGQTGLDQLGDGCILGDIVADAEVTAQHVGYIAEELYIDGLIQTVLCVQGCAHFRRQLFIVERRTGHQLHEDEQHQQDGQQRKQRSDDTLERVFFHVG